MTSIDHLCQIIFWLQTVSGINLELGFFLLSLVFAFIIHVSGEIVKGDYING